MESRLENLSQYLAQYLQPLVEELPSYIRNSEYLLNNVMTIKLENMHNSWLYCFTNPLDNAKVKHMSQVQED